MEKQAILRKLASEIVNDYLVKLAAENEEAQKKKNRLLQLLLAAGIPTGAVLAGLANADKIYDKILDMHEAIHSDIARRMHPDDMWMMKDPREFITGRK
ncbi:MAG: hypothetical protein QW733_07100 [Desulfurococcaceae archaeon]